MLQMLDLGRPVDVLTKDELAEALAEDARLRSTLAGVKPQEVFIPSGLIPAVAGPFTTSGAVPQCPANGYIWAVMQIGCDLSASAALNIYKATAATIGQGGKPVVHNGAAGVQTASFAKGQLWLRPGEQLTFSPATGFLLSAFIVAIEVPAERVGELLI